MSTERVNDGPAVVEPSPPPPRTQTLPSDLLLEIAAHSDATTVVRCAAASKALRRSIHDPAFRRLLALRRSGGFDPALLLGVSYQVQGGDVAVTSPRVRLDAATILADTEWLPEASRDGLLLLRRVVLEKMVVDHRVYLTSPLVLRACDASTGHVGAPLPEPAGLKRHIRRAAGSKDYATDILAAAGERGFEVVAMDMHLQVQIYSSEAGAWGAARAVRPAPARPWLFVERDYAPCSAAGAVIGRTAHWLCFRRAEQGGMVVLALHADTARAAEVEVPEGCLGRIGGDYEKHTAALLLHAGAGGRLGLVAAEADAVTVWALDSLSDGGSRWSRRAVIGREAIARQLVCWDVVDGEMRLEGLGERSGTVLLSTRRFRGLAQLSLVTGKVLELRSGWVVDVRRWSPCVHDTDLGSLLLQGMKHF